MLLRCRLSLSREAAVSTEKEEKKRPLKRRGFLERINRTGEGGDPGRRGPFPAVEALLSNVAIAPRIGRPPRTKGGETGT